MKLFLFINDNVIEGFCYYVIEWENFEWAQANNMKTLLLCLEWVNRGEYVSF